jgi:hypothetical protein
VDLRLGAVALLASCAAAGTGCGWCQKQDYSPVATRVAVFPYAFFGKDLPADFDGPQLVATLEANPGYAASVRALEKDHVIRARRHGESYVLLVCTRDGERAILQDLGCTPGRVDSRLWETAPDHPCAFDEPPPDACPP